MKFSKWKVFFVKLSNMAGISREKENLQNDLSKRTEINLHQTIFVTWEVFFSLASSGEKLKIISVFFYPFPKNHLVFVCDCCVANQLN